MSEPRFYVLEHSGYPIQPGGIQDSRRLQTEVLILNRLYCHRVVWSSLTTAERRTYRSPQFGKRGQRIADKTKHYWSTARQWPLDKRRAYAADLAATLNAEHG